MRIWRKLTLGFALTATSVVSAYGVYQLREEERDLRRVAARDVVRIGAAVQVAVRNALRDTQRGDIPAIVDSVTGGDRAITVAVFDTSGGAWHSFATRREDPEGTARTTARARAPADGVVRFDGAYGLSRASVTLPVQDNGAGRLGTVVIERDLDELRSDLWGETRATVLSLVTLSTGLAVAGWWLASTFVRRPLLAFVETMRAVRAGNLSAKATASQADEIGLAVTEFNALIGELQEAQERLRTEAEQREALEARLQRADKLITVGQLSAGLAHEIGSPLQVLNGRARTLAARHDLPVDVQRSARILERESDRVAHIVQQLVTFSRRLVPHMVDADLHAPVLDIIELLEGEARRRGVRLTFDSEPGRSRAWVDVGQVQQIVMNLVSNGLRATGAGGEIRVALRPVTFAFADGGERAAVALVVEDSGTGIPEHLAPHVFEPFFTTQADTGGTGLGLAVVKSIVDAHGGAIALTRGPDGGARFTVHVASAQSARTGGWVVA